ncbi:secreted antigen 1 [Babesia caballi]|uniref:Secreted antigen 1 n=1 Tax=Babesia caballi TaxID=5871 RepID=A0AAV4LM52_BABCB|nr:secreted antigen 1 [Babesia caballi]
MTVCPSVPPPKSLKDALDLFGALGQGNLKERVGTALERRVAQALGRTDVPQSVAHDCTFNTISQNFEKVLTKLNELRTAIVDNGDHTTYGKYDHLESSCGEVTCVEICTDHFLGILPQLYATLSFMLFKVDDTYSELGGGGWFQQYFNGKNHAVSAQGKSLHQWLTGTGTTGIPSALGSSPVSSPTLLPGGYENDLSQKLGDDLVGTLNDLIIDFGEGADGFLQHSLLDIAVITEWSPCNTAACLVVVRALCEDCDSHKSQIDMHNGLGQVINDVLSNLKVLAPKHEDEDDEALLTALFDGRAETYLKRLEPGAFERCMRWFHDKLGSLIGSLNLLKTDSTKWNHDGLQEAKTSGPFGYGFSFGGKWKSNWSDQIRSQIPEAITKLTTDLTKLQQILKQHFNGSGSSAGSIAGGFLGTAAVGGVGTAMALNVGGVTTALKGAIGILK